VIIEMIDPPLREATTDAEVQRRGSGFTHLLAALRSRGTDFGPGNAVAGDTT
jgi:hypothetical protein